LPAGGKLPMRFVDDTGGMQRARLTKNVTEAHEFKVVEVGNGRSPSCPRRRPERLRKHQVVGTGKVDRREAPTHLARRVHERDPSPVDEVALRQASRGGCALGDLRGRADGLPAHERVVKQMNSATRVRRRDDDPPERRPVRAQPAPRAEFAQGKSLADEFKGHRPRAAARASRAPVRPLPARVVRFRVDKYTKAVLGRSTASFGEHGTHGDGPGRRSKTAPSWRSASSHLRAGDRRRREGAEGTEAQVDSPARSDRMYGQYQKFSPGRRETLLALTPFLPWYLKHDQVPLSPLPATIR